METKTLLLQSALKLFMRYGIKSVSMDDISREMGMSKKTLYQYVADKKDLVNQSVEYHFTIDKQVCDQVLSVSKNAIKQLIDLAQHLTKSMGEMNPSTIYDLQKYYPQAWKIAENHRESYIIDCVKRNIEHGKEANLYRTELDTGTVARLYVTLVESALQADYGITAEANHSKLFLKIIDYHLHALMNDNGRKYFQTHKESLTV